MKEEKIILEKKLNDFEDDIFEGKDIICSCWTSCLQQKAKSLYYIKDNDTRCDVLYTYIFCSLIKVIEPFMLWINYLKRQEPPNCKK